MSTAPGVADTSLCIVARPPRGMDVDHIGDEQKYVTILFLGDVTDEADLAEVHSAVEGIAESGNLSGGEYPVRSIEPLGDDGATVWMLDAGDEQGLLHTAREWLLENETIKRLFDSIEQYPTYIPHMTITYGEVPPEAEQVESISLSRLAVWHGDSQTEYAIGGEDMPETEEPEVTPADAGRVPFYSVLAPEGVPSGDKRKFAEGSLRHRNLPLPLTWQKTSADGHDNNVTVAKIERIARVDNEMRATGYFLSIPEADEVIGLIGEFGRFGVSVDADDSQFEFDEASEELVFSDARICSACIVSIPAFAEAFVSLGEGPDGFMPEREDEVLVASVFELEEGMEAPEDAVCAHEGCEEWPTHRADSSTENWSILFCAAHAEEHDGDDLPDEIALIASGGAVGFKRGPGWVTHPKETRRIHDYWTRPGEPGYTKIGWGTPNDFNRCRALVGEKIAKNSPEDTRYLNQICAQWHHDALGIWPGEHAAASDVLTDTSASPAISLVSAGGWAAPSEWFTEPEDIGSGIVVTDEGRTYGYIAEWGVCHIGYDGVCTEAPESLAEYAYFSTGTVRTADGTDVAVGSLTIDTGHAPGHLRARPAASHYDNTGSVWAYVAVGENERGIWFSGMVKPGTPEDTINTVKASGRLSGDWRNVGGNLELVAALTVNVPGFPITKPTVGMVAGAQNSLVAAGAKFPQATVKVTTDPDLVKNIAAAVLSEINAQSKRAERMEALKSKIGGQ